MSFTGKCTMKYYKFGFLLSYYILYPGSLIYTQILFAVSDIFFTNILPIDSTVKWLLLAFFWEVKR
jgi:hypothetical protein